MLIEGAHMFLKKTNNTSDAACSFSFAKKEHNADKVTFKKKVSDPLYAKKRIKFRYKGVSNLNKRFYINFLHKLLEKKINPGVLLKIVL